MIANIKNISLIKNIKPWNPYFKLTPYYLYPYDRQH